MMRLLNRMPARVAAVAGLVVAGAMVFGVEPKKDTSHEGPPQPWSKWKVHDMDRPVPPVVTPGTASTPEKPGTAPSDAIVLFDGTDLSKWQAVGGGEPTFTLEKGEMLSTNLKDPKNNKYLESKEHFGDIQLHVEFAAPTPPKGDSQGRGNSGVFLMGKFEVQVLDSYNNRTYADGQCSAVYGQYPPQVNVNRPPGEWQTYDIIFHRPRYTEGKFAEPAYVTVLQNGVLTQDHQRIEGPTGHRIVAKYPESGFPEKGPLQLQFHGNPVHYRNIWVRAVGSPGSSATHRRSRRRDGAGPGGKAMIRFRSIGVAAKPSRPVSPDYSPQRRRERREDQTTKELAIQFCLYFEFSTNSASVRLIRHFSARPPYVARRNFGVSMCKMSDGLNSQSYLALFVGRFE